MVYRCKGDELVKLDFIANETTVNVDSLVEEYELKKSQFDYLQSWLQQIIPCLQELGRVDAAGRLVKQVEVDQVDINL